MEHSPSDEATIILRTAPSPRIPLDSLLEQACECCGSDNLSVSRYPGFISRFFAGLLLLHCPDCGLSWVPIPDIDLDTYYRYHYSKEFRQERMFEGEFFSSANPVWSRKRHPVRDRAATHADLLDRLGPIKTILDIGCGEGFLLHRINADRKYAFELDEYGRKILEKEVGATLIDSMTQDNFFDVIVASHVLEHFTYENIRTRIAEIYKCLVPGGTFLAEVPTGAQQLLRFEKGNRKPTERLEPHTLFFSSYALNRMLVEVGFTILQSTVCPWTQSHFTEAKLEKCFKGVMRIEGALVVMAQKPKAAA